MLNKMKIISFLSGVYILLMPLFTYSNLLQEFGIYMVSIPQGWAVDGETEGADYFSFHNTVDNFYVNIKKRPQSCEDSQTYNRIILAIIQEFNKKQEFVEQRKPAFVCQVMGQKSCNLMVLKSKVSGQRKFMLNVNASGNLFEFLITGDFKSIEIPTSALEFIRMVGLIDGSIQPSHGNPEPVKNETVEVENDDALSTYKKVKPYGTSKTSEPSATPEMGETVKAETSGAIFQVAKNSLPHGKSLTISNRPANFDILKDVVEPEQMAEISKEMDVIKVLEIGPHGQKFENPGKVEIEISKNEIPAGKTINDIAVVLISDGMVEDVPFKTTNKGIEVEIPHCSFLLAAAITIPILTAVGGLAMYLKGSTEPMNRKDCAKWIDPENSKIKSIASDPSRFNINSKGDIFADVGTPMKGLNVGQGKHFVKPGNFISNPVGDCVNFSSLYGSLLAAKGYPIRLVAGNAKYPKYSGGHQWVETVIDGKAYYVDTYTPGKTKLVPLEVAKKCYELKPGKMCYPDSPKTYKPDWYNDVLNNKDSQLNHYYELRAEHRVLQEFCVAGDEAACKEGTEIYREAMQLRKQLEAKGVKVVE